METGFEIAFYFIHGISNEFVYKNLTASLMLAWEQP
jgi:hypothetical protein